MRELNKILVFPFHESCKGSMINKRANSKILVAIISISITFFTPCDCFFYLSLYHDEIKKEKRIFEKTTTFQLIEHA